MFSKITRRFKAHPLLYYAVSIAASWAGVGSLMNFRTITYENGLVPAIIWGLGNSLACVLFGIIVLYVPEMRHYMRTKPVKIFLGFMGVGQVWLNMNGIREIFADTPIGLTGGTIIAYAVCIFFIFLLLKYGMIRNVLTDDFSWAMVYGLMLLVTALAYIRSGGAMNDAPLGLDRANLGVGFYKSFLLLPGPFIFAYFFELLDYNESNEDSTDHINITAAFALGGLFFGIYMVFAGLLALVEFSPALNLIKAALVAFVGVSTLSSFLYSEYILWGRKLGLVIDAGAALLWQVAIPMGVMGIWQAMAEYRAIVVAICLALSFIHRAKARREALAK